MTSPNQQVPEVSSEALRLLRRGAIQEAFELVGQLHPSVDALAQSVQIYHAELKAQAEELKDSHHRLGAAVERFRALFECVPIPALVADGNGMLLSANQLARREFGVQVTPNTYGLLMRLIVGAEARAGVQRALTEAEAKNESSVGPYEILDAHGRSRRCQIFVHKLPDAGQARAEYAIVLVDLSEQIAIEEQQRSLIETIRERERRVAELASIAQRTSNIVIVCDRFGLISWVNPAFERATEYVMAEVLGRSPGSILQGPGTDPASVALMRDRLRRGLAVEGLEILNYAKSGRPYWLLIDIQPVHDETGALAGFVAVEADVTRLKDLQLSLRHAEAMHRAILDTDPEFIAAVRPDGVITQVNAAGAKLLGYLRTSDLEGIPLFELVSEESLTDVSGALSQASLGLAGERDIVLRTAGGDPLPARMHTRQLLVQGTHEGTVVMFRDLRPEIQRANLEAKAAAAEAGARARLEFISKVSHAFRTPLNSIVGFTQLLARVPNGRLPSDLEHLAHIENASRVMLKMIDEVLDLSQIQSGAHRINSESVSVPDVLKTVELMLIPLSATQPKVVFSTSFVDDPIVIADRVRLVRIIASICEELRSISGSVAAAELEVKVSSTEQDGSVQVEFCVATKQAPKRDEQTDPQTVDRAIGANSGLLAFILARSLLEQMSGALSERWTSEQVQITLTLPKAASKGALKRHTQHRVDGTANDQYRVLYVEDNAANVELVRAILSERADIELTCVPTAEEAWELMSRWVPSLLLLDLQLPGMSGIELKQRVNADPRFAEIPSILITANATAEAADRAAEVGFSKTITKPFDISELLACVSGYLAPKVGAL